MIDIARPVLRSDEEAKRTSAESDNLKVGLQSERRSRTNVGGDAEGVEKECLAVDPAPLGYV